MHWFLLALLAPILWAFTNHADKYLLSKYFKVDGVGALMIFSTLFGVFVLPIAAYMDPSFVDIGIRSSVLLMIAGICNATAIILYLYALQGDETSIVVPFFQTIPIFGYMLGYLFFKETLSVQQIIAGAIILLGTVILSLKLESGRGRFKWKIAILMLVSSFVFAMYEALFKYGAVADGFWIAAFWEHAGLCVFGGVLFLAVPSYRKEFNEMLRKNSLPIMSLNVASEVLTIFGNICTNLAALMAPLVLVLLVSSYQPLFVFIVGVVLTLFFPKITKENLQGKYLVQKILALIIIFIGSYLLYIQ